MDTFSSLVEHVASLSGNVAIVTHDNPDADAVGSVVALEHVLVQLGVNVSVIFQTKVSDAFASLLSRNRVDRRQAERMYFETVFVLDCSASQRVDIDLKAITSNVVVVDHHVGFQEFGNLNYVEDVAATAVLIDRLIMMIISTNAQVTYTSLMATAIYMALRGDTANFKADNVSADVLRLAADLLDREADVQLVNEIERNELAVIKLMGKVLDNVNFDERYNIAYLMINDQQIHAAGATMADASRLIDVIRDVRNVDVAYLFIKNRGRVFIKARSVDVNVADILQEYGGGGHPHAAGAVCSADSPYVLMRNVLELTRQNMVNH